MDETKRPVRIPSDFATYAERHELYSLFQDMLQQLLVDRPADPLQHARDFLVKPSVQRTIVVGPPAAGKSTVSVRTMSGDARAPGGRGGRNAGGPQTTEKGMGAERGQSREHKHIIRQMWRIRLIDRRMMPACSLARLLCVCWVLVRLK